MKCIVNGCSSSQRKQNKQISFHKFPVLESRRQKWISALQLENKKIKTFSVVCCAHFHESSFIGQTSKLFPSAVPYIDNIVDDTSMESDPLALYTKNIVDESMPRVISIESAEELISSNSLVNETSIKNAISSDVSSYQSPKRDTLNRKLNILIEVIKKREKEIKCLSQKVRRQKKRISSLSAVLKTIKEKNIINNETSEILQNVEAMNADLLERKFRKEKGVSACKKFNPALRLFALKLHLLSPKAYKFMRANFDNCLPHSRTLAKWYEVTDCYPGSTKEAFSAITDN